MRNPSPTSTKATAAMTEAALDLPYLHAGFWRDSADDLADFIAQVESRIEHSEIGILLFVGGMLRKQAATLTGAEDLAADLFARLKKERAR